MRTLVIYWVLCVGHVVSHAVNEINEVWQHMSHTQGVRLKTTGGRRTDRRRPQETPQVEP